MPYREEWVSDIIRGRSVLQTALDVHSTARGSLERSQGEQNNDARALRRVVETWTPNECVFDNAALQLIHAALAEWQQRRNQQAQDKEMLQDVRNLPKPKD